MTEQDSPWLTVDEAATYLKISRTSIYRYCEQGRLRYYELESGGGRRFRTGDLDRLLKQPNKENGQWQPPK